MQYYGIDKHLIPFAAERSPSKWNKYTVGTGIKIISEKKLEKMNPDYFFVTPWGLLMNLRKENISGEKKVENLLSRFLK